MSTTMRRVNVLNPVAGQGKAGHTAPANGENYYTTGVGDAAEFIRKTAIANPDTHFFVYGGDGTASEAVNGILSAGTGERSVLSVIPTGTGNDLVRNFPSVNQEPRTVDAISCNGTYAINIINAGFDSNVVCRAARLKTKPLISGSGAYLLGVAGELMSQLGQHLTITFTDVNGQEQKREDEYLLCVIANACYYGGGFYAMPEADMRDGLLDILLVKKVTRRRFLSLLGAYQKGRHIVNGAVVARFADIMEYVRASNIRVQGLKTICIDGEVTACESAEVRVIPGAIRYAPARREGK